MNETHKNDSLDYTNEISGLKERISQLESEKAQLQRVVQVKDEALNWMSTHGNQSGVIPCPQDYSYYVKPIQVKAEQALEVTPKDLPKFVTEEEYLRVKQSAQDERNMLEACQEDYVKLKAHAEAMAESINDLYRPVLHPEVEAYRKDFPHP